MSYDPAQICKNKHLITPYADIDKHVLEKFCSICGAETIVACPYCSEFIRGKDIDIKDREAYKIPSYCHECGQPYPWTKSALEAIAAIIEEDEEITSDDKVRLTESLPDIISENPKTQLAVVRFKKAFKVAGKFTADAMRQFIIDFGSEVVVKQLNQNQQ